MSGTEVPTTRVPPTRVAPTTTVAPTMKRRRVRMGRFLDMARPLTRDRGGILDRRSNPLIGPASTDIAAHRVVDVLVVRVGRRGEEGRCRHDLARLAIAALRHVMPEPGRLDRMTAAQPFDR